LEIQNSGAAILQNTQKECISANSLSICIKFDMLIDTVNTSVISGPKCHFLEIKMAAAILENTHILAFFISLHQI